MKSWFLGISSLAIVLFSCQAEDEPPISKKISTAVLAVDL